MSRKNVYLAVLSSVLISGVAISEPEVTGKITIEAASYTENEFTQDAYAYNNSAAQIGATSSHGSDNMKSEVSGRIYIDGNLEEIDSTYHIELQAFSDDEAVANYQDNESYTQRDGLREAYIDTSYEDWLIRAGKQQVVWGTADGMKLLDNINPTDFSEMAQNQMEDSRIPVWMLNAEKTLEDGGNFQFIISQPKENIFAGLNRNISTAERANLTPSLSASKDIAATSHDQGHPFILKGVDSITGRSNGFLNLVPDLGSVASMFGAAFGTDAGSDGYAGLDPDLHGATDFFTVGSFNTSSSKLAALSTQYGQVVGGYGGANSAGDDGFDDLVFGTTGFWTAGAGSGSYYTGQQALQGFANFHNISNLLNTDSKINSVFEYMNRTPFTTFDAFVGATSKYKYKMPDSSKDQDYSMRYKNTTSDGLNYSLNYSYAYDKNPIINLSWEDGSGNALNACRKTHASDLPDGVNSGNTHLVLTTAACTAATANQNSTVGGGAGYNGVSSTKHGVLVFEQEVKRVHNIGGSFDMAIETDTLGPVVIRGEAVYQKDTYSPVMDKGALSIGDLTSALTMRKGDRFKYVLGADITALTNMMVSMQFIQDKNLDYIDSKVDFDGSTSCAVVNCGVYTTDYATMHLTNGFNKAAKDKNFYSLYLSKPYGESGQHRWNNITIFEETGGYWNRLDTEYTLDDNTVLTGEINSYWGDENTQFGQLKTSSNVQVGLKYSF